MSQEIPDSAIIRLHLCHNDYMVVPNEDGLPKCFLNRSNMVEDSADLRYFLWVVKSELTKEVEGKCMEPVLYPH